MTEDLMEETTDDDGNQGGRWRKVRKYGEISPNSTKENDVTRGSEWEAMQGNRKGRMDGWGTTSFRDKLMANSEVIINKLMIGDEITLDHDDDSGYEPPVQEGPNPGPVVMFSKEERGKLREPWRRTLIVKLLGKNLSYNFLYSRLRQKWGNFHLMDLGHDFYVAKFENDDDLQFVLNEGPWMIAGHYLTIQRWKPGFRPETTGIPSTATWIRLPSLPVEYFNQDALTRIGDVVGRTLKIDRNTASSTRGKFARICVEIDLRKPLNPRVFVDNAWQKVEYEGLHLVCFGCGCYGHRKDNCPQIIKERHTTEEKETRVPMEEVTMPTEKEEDYFGPWMLAPQRPWENEPRWR